MSINFLASFPDIQSAIKINGGGDGMRIQLDIPESEFVNAVELLAFRGKVVQVTIEAPNNQDRKDNKDDRVII